MKFGVTTIFWNVNAHSVFHFPGIWIFYSPRGLLGRDGYGIQFVGRQLTYVV